MPAAMKISGIAAAQASAFAAIHIGARRTCSRRTNHCAAPRITPSAAPAAALRPTIIRRLGAGCPTTPLTLCQSASALGIRPSIHATTALVTVAAIQLFARSDGSSRRSTSHCAAPTIAPSYAPIARKAAVTTRISAAGGSACDCATAIAINAARPRPSTSPIAFAAIQSRER